LIEWEDEGEEEEEGDKSTVHLESKKVRGFQSKVFCPLPLTSFDAPYFILRASRDIEMP